MYTFQQSFNLTGWGVLNGHFLSMSEEEGWIPRIDFFPSSVFPRGETTVFFVKLNLSRFSITKTQKISTWNMETFLCKVHTIMQMTVCKYVSLNEMFKPHHKIWQPNWMSFNASCNIKEKKLFKELRQLREKLQQCV